MFMYPAAFTIVLSNNYLNGGPFSYFRENERMKDEQVQFG